MAVAVVLTTEMPPVTVRAIAICKKELNRNRSGNEE
jgi:hypothetical protein